MPVGKRRMFPRLKCLNSVELQPDAENSPIWGKIVKLGVEGCFIEMPIPCAQAQSLKMGFWIQEMKI